MSSFSDTYDNKSICTDDSQAPHCTLKWYSPYALAFLVFVIALTIGFAVARKMGYCLIERVSLSRRRVTELKDKIIFFQDPWNPARKPNQSDEEYEQMKKNLQSLHQVQVQGGKSAKVFVTPN